ncbi:MAG TPA: peptide-methionine (R)-S-oxide reductase MsrB [Caulobacteraceae bacterium]|nr:peptide-methionine (R)-S-oxide reductase MsrB [Caulobacteraceae bacterium]
MTRLDRRSLFFAGAALLAAPAALARGDPFAASPWRKLSDADWKKRLDPLGYAVLRHGFTEQPNTSPLEFNWKRGTYVCKGCGLPLFRSTWKYDSHTGWPSFWTVMTGAVAKKADFQLIEPRTEYHCARCLGHQGHVFDDGPRPTGLRYCNNGAALNFIAA